MTRSTAVAAIAALVVTSLGGGLVAAGARRADASTSAPRAAGGPAARRAATASLPPRSAVPVALGPRTVGGLLAVVRVEAAAVARNGARRYVVEVEPSLASLAADFVRVVDDTLADPRGWAGGSAPGFTRVDAGPVDFRVTLATPDVVDRLCRPLRTAGRFSCYRRGRAVINARRWREGAATYGGDVDGYRRYVVNHEVGHALGRGHRRCPGRGLPAPVMVQQTKGLDGCRANPWPRSEERRRA